MIHPDGLRLQPGVPEPDGRSLIDTRRLFYYGNSQGGIAGGALTAVAPDFDRSVLYVGAMNYSLLLNRSVDFDRYALILYPYYPNPLERQLVLSMIQMLWDRGEPNGYAWHMTGDPLPNTPRHKVLQLLSFGDHQVANLATEVEARTIGSHLRAARGGPGPARGPRALLRHPADPALPVRGRRVARGLGHRPAAPPGCGAAGAPSALARPRRRSRTCRRAIGVDPHDLVIQSEARVRRQISEFLRVDGTRDRRVRRLPATRPAGPAPERLGHCARCRT